MPEDKTTRRAAQPRWKRARFGGGLDLYIRDRWLGSVEPQIQGECRFTTRTGRGNAATQDEAKRLVEAQANA